MQLSKWLISLHKSGCFKPPPTGGKKLPTSQHDGSRWLALRVLRRGVRLVLDLLLWRRVPTCFCKCFLYINHSCRYTYSSPIRSIWECYFSRFFSLQKSLTRYWNTMGPQVSCFWNSKRPKPWDLKKQTWFPQHLSNTTRVHLKLFLGVCRRIQKGGNWW